MTNEEREALIAQGWTPPVAVDPDLVEVREIVAQIYDVSWPERADAIRTGLNDYDVENVCALKAIKRGRALATAEAKPGINWVKRGQQDVNPFDKSTLILVKFISGHIDLQYSTVTALWSNITHYAVITPPEEDVA